VRIFVERLADSGVSCGLLALHITAVRTIFDHICARGVAPGLSLPKRARSLPETITEEQAEAMLRNAKSIRDQLLLGLLYGTGLSVAEIRNLRWQDIRQDGQALHVTKSRRYRERVVSAPAAFVDILKAGASVCEPAEHVFRGRREGTALSVRMIELTVRAAAKAAGVGKPVTAMVLRHSYAVHRLENGANLRVLQDELGHASIRTTERYRRCLAPAVDPHPFSTVYTLMTDAGESNRRAKRPAWRTGSSRRNQRVPRLPLDGIESIMVSRLHLPFARPENLSNRFAELLRSTFLKCIRRPGSP
jgi:site-specific recombinase XerD